MRLGIVATSFVIGSLSLVVACSSTDSGNGQNPGSSSGNTSSGNTADGGSPNGDSGNPSSSSGGVPEASKVDAPVDIDGACPSLNACGGSLAGTYDYTSGCVDDVFAAARNSCPALDTTGAKVSVKGSLHFVNGALTRAATSTVSGTVIVPASCAAGQCALAESLLKSAFPSAKCTGTSSCSCTVNDTKAATNTATTYTISGTTVTTGDGDTYSFCVDGPKLTYEGKAAGAEDGIWTLVKR